MLQLYDIVKCHKKKSNNAQALILLFNFAEAITRKWEMFNYIGSFDKPYK